MMQAAAPVDGNVGQLLIKLHRPLDAGASVAPTEVIQAVKDWTVLPHIELHKLAQPGNER